MYDNFFAKASELTQQGVAFATATVVRAEAPTSGKPGDKAIITGDGIMHGWIGGSCAQPTVVAEALAVLRSDTAKLIRLSTDADPTPRPGLTELPMSCYSGGTLEIYIEPHLPRPRLLIVGNLPVAQSLAHLGKAMNYHVVAVDVEKSGAMNHADSVLHEMAQLAAEVRPNTYVVVATHGNYDETALAAIMAARPAYVGLVASKKRAEQVFGYLRQSGFGDNELLALKAPAGLDIRARRGDEIALSIMAEIVEKRRSAELFELTLLQPDSIPSAAAEERCCSSGQDATAAKYAQRVAIDPICQMEVDTETAVHLSEYAGKAYFFCCHGCKVRFDANSAEYDEAFGVKILT